MFEIQDWGVIEYNMAWERQKQIVADIQSSRNRNVLVFCEHPSVITIGKSGSGGNVVANRDFLQQKGIQVIESDRGGDVTLHNPGQLVGYPIFNLNDFKQDLHWFLREIEECIIETIASFGLVGGRSKGQTGVWLEEQRKICAIGMHCSRWVTSHGFALNVSNDLREFSYIIPCGIVNKGVTSLEQEVGTPIDMNLVKSECENSFGRHFF